MKRIKLLTLLSSLFAVFAGSVHSALAQPGMAPPQLGNPAGTVASGGYPPGYMPPLYSPQQEGYPPYGAYAQRPDSGEEPVPFISRYRVDSNIGEGLGYSEGYTSFSAFVPWDFNSANSLFFLDFRGYATHSRDGGMGDGGGANIGFGHRTYFGAIDRYFGLSGWFDVDSGHENTYTQAGVSLESVGKWVDIRVNGYFGIDDKQEQTFSGFVGDPFFRGNNIMLLNRTLTEVQYQGWDAEVGGPVPYFGGIGVSGFVGGYMLWSSGEETATGVQARVEANVNDDVQIGGKLTSDRVFGTNLMANVTLTLPRGTLRDWFSSEWFRPSSVHERMDRQVQRNYRIPINEKTDDTEIAAINPADNEPFFVLHIDSNAPTNGNGTFENPFDSTQNFVNNPEADIIRVVAGVPENLHRNGSIDLLNDQRLLSASVQHTVTATQGTFNLPGFNNSPLPELFNDDLTPSQVVSLSDNDNDQFVNEVSGFILNGSGIHDGIASVPGGITGFNINRNEFAAVVNGVILTDVGTDGTITRAIVDNVADGIGTGAGGGFFVTFVGATVNSLIVTNNTAFDFQGEDVNQNDVLDFGEDTNLDTLLTPGNGIAVIATAASNVTGEISGNTASVNETGLIVTATGGSVVNVAVAGNTLTQNIGTDTGVHFTADASLMNALVTENEIDDNKGSQMIIETSNAAVVDFTLIGNTFNRVLDGTVGLNIDAQSGSFVTLTGNLNDFTGGNPDTSHGLQALINDSTFDLTLAGTSFANQDGNLFQNNRGAGVFIELSGAADGTVSFLHNAVIGTIDDLDPLTAPAGDGVYITTLNTSTLHDSVFEGNVIGTPTQINTRHGLAIVATDSSTVENILIGNIGADDGNGGLFDSNDGSGIAIRREVNATVDNIDIVDVTAQNNQVGIDLQAIGSASDAMDVLVEDNVIQTNGTGIQLQLGSDAQLDVDIIDNLIAENTGDGILSFEDVNTSSDPRFLTGLWVTNQIIDNGRNGINLHAAMNNLQVGLNGVGADGKTLGNLVARNGLTGVLIGGAVNFPGDPGPGRGGAGTATFTNNDVINNGLLAGTDGRFGHGFDIEGDSFKDMFFIDNLVRGNLHDGFEIENDNQSGDLFLTAAVFLTLDGNSIELNGGRGIDILNKSVGDAQVTINNNVINGNALEGVYVVNTASVTQNQSDPTPDTDTPDTDPTHGMDADGLVVGVFPTLRFFFDNNIVTGNGEGSDFAGTGLVIRVGTAGGGYGFQSPGGFTSTLPQDAFATDGAGNMINAGVFAVITDNMFAGNFGNDVYFESFTSTVDPITTAGTWTNMGTPPFTVTAFEGDPLARMDLVFTGNIVVNRGFNNLGGFYDNGEGVFKSRLNDADPAGPFFEADRRRNAQRLAFRDQDPGDQFFPPTGPNALSRTFQYPGIGESTFRISSGSDTTGFILDNQPWDDPTDNNGVDLGGAITGEEPYGWSVFP